MVAESNDNSIESTSDSNREKEISTTEVDNGVLQIGTGNPHLLLKYMEACVEIDDQVIIKEYCSMWIELCGFMSKWGRIFKFVIDDVTAKVNGLQARMGELPEDCTTISLMMELEAEREIMRTTHPKSATLNTLVLHRALKFVAQLLEGVYNCEDENAKVSTIARGAYDNTLGHHHSWLIRKVVGAALLALPYRKEFLVSMRGDMKEEDDDIFFGSFKRNVELIDSRVEASLLHHDMLDFK